MLGVSTKMTENVVDVLSFIKEYPHLFVCPHCGFDLEIEDNIIRCKNTTELCGLSFNAENDIPKMFFPHDNMANKSNDVTNVVKAFYERTPFPNYDDIDSIQTLTQKARRGIYARLLDEQIPYGVRILEVGCGTGQLTNFLSIPNRTVIGTDLSIASLKLAHEFKKSHNLGNAYFYQMNLFKPIFKKESFHVVICSGVLHHTSDPYEGFKSIVKLTKVGGYIIIGVYNKYGRFFTKLRKQFFRLSGDHIKKLDPRIRTDEMGETRKQTWFEDQYKNPHESAHTIGEILRWFDANDIQFINGYPKLDGSEFGPQENLFEPQEGGMGNSATRILAQLGYVFRGSKQGGLFVMIGKRMK